MRRLLLLLLILVGPGAGSAAAQLPALADVRHWLYLLDVELSGENDDLVQQIAASAYDLVVLDFIPSDVSSTDFPMARLVDRLHDAPQPKLVIAYIDIAQAEDFRTYWQPGWGIGDPEWIISADPDGWEGDFPVAYWYDEWRDIWLGDGGYLESLIGMGFDGVYLDWVEAYSDSAVVDFAESDGVDPLEEMIWWVQDIAEYSRTLQPGFIVIAQNAAELAEYADYVEVIDAIAQEQVWFDGGADNDPPGDCPLPRTEADLDTPAYVQSLSGGCLRLYADDPESTLHTSSAAYIAALQVAQQQGVIIFTVDYALEPANVRWVYCTSRGLGFIPFVGSRALDRYVEPYLNPQC